MDRGYTLKKCSMMNQGRHQKAWKGQKEKRDNQKSKAGHSCLPSMYTSGGQKKTNSNKENTGNHKPWHKLTWETYQARRTYLITASQKNTSLRRRVKKKGVPLCLVKQSKKKKNNFNQGGWTFEGLYQKKKTPRCSMGQRVNRKVGKYRGNPKRSRPGELGGCRNHGQVNKM